MPSKRHLSAMRSLPHTRRLGVHEQALAAPTRYALAPAVRPGTPRHYDFGDFGARRAESVEALYQAFNTAGAALGSQAARDEVVTAANRAFAHNIAVRLASTSFNELRLASRCRVLPRTAVCLSGRCLPPSSGVLRGRGPVEWRSARRRQHGSRLCAREGRWFPCRITKWPLARRAPTSGAESAVLAGFWSRHHSIPRLLFAPRSI